MSSERIQFFIHKMESGAGARIIWTVAAIAAVVGLTVMYDFRAYHNFNNQEAMDSAQVARNLAEGHGFTTEFIRPFSLYLVQKHNQGKTASGTNDVDAACVNGFHPDLANAPLYPALLAGLMKTWKPEWQVDTIKPFWSEGGQFQRYKPEFRIAIFNQVLLFVIVGLVFFIARKLFDGPAAWLSAVFTLGSALLWRFSISGLSTMLLVVIFLGLIWCLIKAEEWGRAEPPPNTGKIAGNAVAIGLLLGLGMLTSYSFGWLILPVAGFLFWFGGPKKHIQAWTAILTFIVITTPWIARNFSVSGTPFGTAGYAIFSGTQRFGGNELMQSLTPDFNGVRWAMPFAHKLIGNTGHLLQSDLLTIGGWAGVLFLAGLLLGWRNLAPTRMRYFTLMSLGVLVLVQALGRTGLSDDSPDITTENLLVLFIPLINIFGAAFLLTLVGQIKVPNVAVRYAVIILVALLAFGSLLGTVVTKGSPSAYPPYYPPEIQKIATWIKPDELMMSDAPWAVAWYGDRQCAWTTLNSTSDFSSLDLYFKSVHGLYLTALTLDGKLLSECFRGSPGSWSKFGLRLMNSMAGGDSTGIPADFSLQIPAPGGQLYGAGFYLTDRPRWLNK